MCLDICCNLTGRKEYFLSTPSDDCNLWLIVHVWLSVKRLKYPSVLDPTHSCNYDKNLATQKGKYFSFIRQDHKLDGVPIWNGSTLSSNGHRFSHKASSWSVSQTRKFSPLALKLEPYILFIRIEWTTIFAFYKFILYVCIHVIKNSQI